MMEALPPPPPLPLNSKHNSKSKLVPVPGFGRRGQPIGSIDDDFYHYNVVLSCGDGSPVYGKGIGRKVIDKLWEIYDTELAGKDFAYDGEKSLFIVGSLPQNKPEFTVILEDLSSNNAAVNGSPKSFKVEFGYVARISMRAIANALCSLGIYSSFRETQGGLSLNIDVSTTMIIQPGPVLDILVANQSVRDPQGIDYAKLRRMLKNLSINASPSNMEYKITGLSDLPCKRQLFSLKQRADGNAEGEVQMTEVTVYDYFVNHRHGQFRFSGDFPCIYLAKTVRPNYIPLEILTVEALPPPPPLPLNSTHNPKSGFGHRGQPITLSTNHFKVALSCDDGSPVDGKEIGRKVINKLQEISDTELAGKDVAYDGEKSLFTFGLSSNKTWKRRIRRPFQSKSFIVGISYAAMILMRAIANTLCSQESDYSQEALRVPDIILRQNATEQGSLLVRPSFFHNRPRNFCDLEGGVLGCRDFHSCFRVTQGCLSLNIDASTTIIIQPEPELDFLVANLRLRDPQGIDWAKTRRMLKNPRINASPVLTDLPCNEQLVPLKQRTDGKAEKVQTTEVTVYDYFVKYDHIQLCYSGDRLKEPNYIPLELSSLVFQQPVTKAPSSLEMLFHVEKSRPPDGSWNYGREKLAQPMKIEDWAIVNFSLCCDIKKICKDLDRCAQKKGICVGDPCVVIEENPQARCAPALVRVEQMLEQVTKLPQIPRFILCILPERKSSTIYGPWKRKVIADFHIVTQCITPVRVNDQYLLSVALKMNAKNGVFNCLLAEPSLSMPMFEFGAHSLPFIGTGIALIIHEGVIFATSEGRTVLDVDSMKKNKIVDTKILEDALVPNMGKILKGNQQKIFSLGKSILVASTGASISFDEVEKDLRAQCAKGGDIKIEKAISICCDSIQRLLATQDFDATVTLCGFKQGKPVICSFQNMKRGDVCSKEMKETNEELAIVALGSGRETIEKHIKRCNLVSSPGLSVPTLFKHLEPAVSLCGLKDRNCGGFLSIAVVDSDPTVSIYNSRHSVSAFAEHYDEMKNKWSKRLLYVCHSQEYDLTFEKKFEQTLGSALLHGGLPDVEFSTHVLGVNLRTSQIVGVIHFLDADTVKSANKIVSDLDWTRFFSFYEASVELLHISTLQLYTREFGTNNYGVDALLRATGISSSSTEIEGRVR